MLIMSKPEQGEEVILVKRKNKTKQVRKEVDRRLEIYIINKKERQVTIQVKNRS